MTEHTPNQELADARELCAMTDALLAGQILEGNEQAPLAGVVQKLACAIAPQAPPEHLRRRIERQIALEWSQSHPSRFQSALASLGQQLRWLFTSPQRRLAWAGLAVAAVAVVATALLIPGGDQLTATAAGGGTILVVGLVVVGLLVVGWLASRRK
ncbi:MAG: hypothetical protein JW850_23630 [Thermoflexales bacterium]|nr:hypothetical protein [Thermoflexales bacterium]